VTAWLLSQFQSWAIASGTSKADRTAHPPHHK
jgi:hypothetical protein